MPEIWLWNRIDDLDVEAGCLGDVIDLAYELGTLVYVDGDRCMGSDFRDSVEKTRLMPKLSSSEATDWVYKNCGTRLLGETGCTSVYFAAKELGYILYIKGEDAYYGRDWNPPDCEQRAA